MSQNQTQLNNTGDAVTLIVALADNLMSVYLNPDISNINGSVKVFETLNFGTAPTGTTIDLTGYLRCYKRANPNAGTVTLVICMSNFGGPGNFQYALSGEGITLAPQNPSLQPWSSQMDSYIVSFF